MATLTLRPTGAGASTQWTPSSGSNWQCVDETSSDGDTSYVAASGAGGLADLYTHAGGVTGGSTINSVTLYAVGRHTGTYGFFLFYVRSGSTSASVAGVKTLTGSYAEYSTAALTENPVTGSAWTVDEVNNFQFGMFDASSSPAMRITQVWAVVDYAAPITATVAASFEPMSAAVSAAQKFSPTIASAMAVMTAALTATQTPVNPTTIETSMKPMTAALIASQGSAPAAVIASRFAKQTAALSAGQAFPVTVASEFATMVAALQAAYDASALAYYNVGRAYRMGSPHFRR